MNQSPRNIAISDYHYDLPAEKIALYPLAERHNARLLIYREGNISEDIYLNIHKYLPEKSHLFFNNTRVINARLKFRKPSGTSIEIFCLEPAAGSAINKHLADISSTTWECFVGNAAKWKNEVLEKEKDGCLLTAKLLERNQEVFTILFNWQPASLTFSEVIRKMGNVPLPPYIKRDAEPSDNESYQTLFAENEGSVAAPTAGLHFTGQVLSGLRRKEISDHYLTLHVGAGTFKPVKATLLGDHEMHAEWIEVKLSTLNILIKSKESVIAVGTTCLRTLESLYWLGVKVYHDPQIMNPELTQWEAYETPTLDKITALSALHSWMEKQNLESFFTQTRLLIMPGYRFRIVDILITNFHQPQSTLLLLVSAAIGESWKEIYEYALKKDFRFLSYGDGSVIYLDQGTKAES